MKSFSLAEIEGQVTSEVEFLGGIEGHLLDEGEYHLDLHSHLKGKQFVVVFSEIEVKSGLGVEAGSHDGFRNAGEKTSSAEDIVEVVLVRIVAHNLGKACIVVENFYIAGDAESDGGTCGEGVVDLHTSPVRFQMDGSLVAVASLQEEQCVQLSISDGSHVFIERVDGPHRLGMLVIHYLHLPKVLVEEVGGAAMLESDAETGSVCENLEIPLLGGHVVVIFPDILGER